MSGVTWTISVDTASPHLKRVLKGLSSGGDVESVMGRAMANELKKHFRDRNKTKNRLGGDRTNFWSRVAESVGNPALRAGVLSVLVSHPAIAQKVKGGRITPTKAQRIAVPLIAAAHGRSPRVIDGLFMYKSRKGNLLLAKADGAGIRNYYVLKEYVDQGRDLDALPKDARMVAALDRAALILARSLGMA